MFQVRASHGRRYALKRVAVNSKSDLFLLQPRDRDLRYVRGVWSRACVRACVRACERAVVRVFAVSCSCVAEGR